MLHGRDRNNILDLQEEIRNRGISMDDLSRRSKIPLSTLYRRFDRKDKLTLVEYNALCKALKVVPVNIACNDKEVELLRLSESYQMKISY
ncbi:helix-turn-helix domain-containing protein [Zooshikella ganghwensis]|uniref:HTH cro/C1-type domain-containing protein n=1 Tax=Zooshikella ganghwensis TaxID=202772 RepID=A0A4P9VDL9_9GAMM|nr:helix-turn-helix domain-containing protein [Zooshikella ganghwensis]RDH41175.1 hypothetical protein B9G39_29670 [Zooshikella ganghwensis]